MSSLVHIYSLHKYIYSVNVYISNKIYKTNESLQGMCALHDNVYISNNSNCMTI